MILTKERYRTLQERKKKGILSETDSLLMKKQEIYDKANYGFFYVFLTPKQAELVEFAKNYNEVIIRGGVRSGKTVVDCFIVCCRASGWWPVGYEVYETIWEEYGKDGKKKELLYKPILQKVELPNTRKKCRIWISCLDRPMQVASGGMQDTLMDMLPKPWIKDITTLCGKYITKIALTSGSTIEFKSAAVGRRGYQSATIDMLLADEAHTEDVIREGLARSGVHPLKFIYSYFPQPEPSTVWAHEAYIVPEIDGKSPAYRKVTTVNYLDNVMIPKPQRDDQVQRWKDAGEYDQRVFGEFGEVQGLVYKEFRRNRHVINAMDIPAFKANGGLPPEDWKVFIGIDTHNSQKGCAALVCAVDPSNGRRIYFDEYQSDGSPDTWFEFLKDWHDKYRFEMGWIDPSAYAKDAAGFCIGEKMEDVTGIPLEKARRDHATGIYAVTMGLAVLRDADSNVVDGLPGILICDHCTRTIRQIESYARKATGEVIKSNDEYCDDMRYIEIAEPQTYFCNAGRRGFIGEPSDSGNPNLRAI